MIEESQVPQRFREVISEQVAIFEKGPVIVPKSQIPDTSEIPLDDQRDWLRIPDVICVYVDMLGSTRLSAEEKDKDAAAAFHFYTGTAVRLFDAFGAPYIDVRGDGAFALFNGSQPNRAFAAAVTFKTFAKNEFVPRVRELSDVIVGSHVGIDMRTVLVRKVGLRRAGGRTDRQNEVWAGKPINMAAKLAARTQDEEMLVSSRYYDKIADDLIRWSCGCPNRDRRFLWESVDLKSDSNFDFDVAHKLKTWWCSTHGAAYCERIIMLDEAAD